MRRLSASYKSTQKKFLMSWLKPTRQMSSTLTVIEGIGVDGGGAGPDTVHERESHMDVPDTAKMLTSQEPKGPCKTK